MFVSNRLTRSRARVPPHIGQARSPFGAVSAWTGEASGAGPRRARTPRTRANTAAVAARDSQRRSTREEFIRSLPGVSILARPKGRAPLSPLAPEAGERGRLLSPLAPAAGERG